VAGPHGVQVGDVHLLIAHEDATTWTRGVLGLVSGLLGGMFGDFEKRRPVLRVSRAGTVIAQRRFQTSEEAEWARTAILHDPPADADPDWQAVLVTIGGA